MLEELRIRNFAIIDNLELTLGPGLVVFTGETGAGKSIIVDAVMLLLGGRAESIVVRAGADRAVLEGIFRLEPAVQAAVQALLEPEGLWDTPDTVVLGREIRRNGRNLARINGRTVNLGLLRAVGNLLVDIHGQAEHLSLFRVREHIRLLDRFAGLEDALAAYQTTYRRLQRTRRRLETLRQHEADAARRADFLAFQIQEIENAGLDPEEETRLTAERERLAHAETLAEHTRQAIFLLDEGNADIPAITDLFGQVAHALETIAQTDREQADLAAAAADVAETLADLTRRLRDYAETLEFDPRRLGAVEERLALIADLKRKYGASIPEILAYAERARTELETITHAEEQIAALEAEIAALESDLAARALALSQQRQQAARKLAAGVETELQDLHMAGARFAVDLRRRPDPHGLPIHDQERVAYDDRGIDKVEFLLAPNPGEGFKPLAKIASGGESSRLMLALKRVLALADPTPTLIFDEIDQGIGGRIGAVVGRKLHDLARHHQVLVITHLPQLAAYGDAHHRVAKNVRNGRTATTVTPLKGEARVRELAQMLGGSTPEMLRSARALLESPQNSPLGAG